MDIKKIKTAIAISIGLLTTVTNSAIKEEPNYRFVGGIVSSHDYVEENVIYTYGNPHYGEKHNQNHNAIGIAKNIDLFDSLDNEYVGIINFDNSYYVNSSAITYEAGHRFGENIVMGGRALMIQGYKRNDNSSGLFISDDISIVAQPFVRYESNPEGVGVFIEASMADFDVPIVSVGITW